MKPRVVSRRHEPQSIVATNDNSENLMGESPTRLPIFWSIKISYVSDQDILWRDLPNLLEIPVPFQPSSSSLHLITTKAWHQGTVLWSSWRCANIYFWIEGRNIDRISSFRDLIKWIWAAVLAVSPNKESMTTEYFTLLWTVWSRDNGERRAELLLNHSIANQQV